MENENLEKSIKNCYSTWGKSYYDDYYGEKAAYPPIHRELIKKILHDNNVQTLLDAGCGPCSILRDLISDNLQLYGFDLTKEMVNEGKRVFEEKGLSPDQIWQGSVMDPTSFKCPQIKEAQLFDAAICIGVLPHIEENQTNTVFKNLCNSVKPDGTVIVECRNQFFSLFTLNRYSYQFFINDLIQTKQLNQLLDNNSEQFNDLTEHMKKHFRIDLPPIRKGKENEPGYDEVLSKTHNPILLKEQFAATGFKDIEILFYHYHCLPPMFADKNPELFRKASLAIEDPHDWRGYFMASAFLLVGKRDK